MLGGSRQTQRGDERLRAIALVIEEIESDGDVDRRGGAGGQVGKRGEDRSLRVDGDSPGRSRQIVAGRRGDQDRGGSRPPAAAYVTRMHKVPVIGLGRDHERAAVDAEVAKRGVRQTDLACQVRLMCLSERQKRSTRSGRSWPDCHNWEDALADGIEVEELAVGLELEDVARVGDGRGARPTNRPWSERREAADAGRA